MRILTRDIKIGQWWEFVKIGNILGNVKGLTLCELWPNPNDILKTFQLKCDDIVAREASKTEQSTRF